MCKQYYKGWRHDSTRTAGRPGIIEDKADIKLRYARRCVQSWKLRRDALLKASRKQTKSGRLTTSEREVILAEFWEEIDREIAAGEIPAP